MTSDPHGDGPRDLAATAPARRRAGAPPLRRTLLVMSGDDVEVRPLPVTGQVAIGRGSACDLVIDHPSISRTHLTLTLAAEGITVTDRGSANGTLLRGVRLPADVPIQVSANEAIAAGDLVLAVQEVSVAAGAGGALAPARPSGQVAVTAGVAPIVVDPGMKRLYELAARVARGSIGVLLVGETGVGKEVLAEHVHRSSPRAGGPLVRVNCAALTDSLVESELFGHEKGAFTGAARERRGLIEAADGGTVFLDEIGEISPAVQAKLLRVLEDRCVLRVGASSPSPIDVRFVAATNRDLESDVAAGRFRRDLYFRLAGAVLSIPPLRDRPAEIEVLARAFAIDAAARLGRPAPALTEPAVAALRAHAWPGNVRELRNVIERAVLLVDPGPITPADLPFDLPADGGAAPVAPAPAAPTPAAAPTAAPVGRLSDELAAIERRRIVDALEQCGGNQTQAAARLGISRRTLINRIEEYGLPRPRKK